MRFEKVKREFFDKDSRNNCFEPTDEVYDSIKLPVRKTSGSAAYDFSTPYDIELYGGERRVVPTGIKAKMDKGEVLLIAPRSSVGIKDGVVFSNSIALIDADYYGCDETDGDIQLALWNSSSKRVAYPAGTRLAQGMFVKFDITEDDNASGERIGGIGSTGNE